MPGQHPGSDALSYSNQVHHMSNAIASLASSRPQATAGTDAWTFADSVPRSYQRYLVPVLFQPFAAAMAERVLAETQGHVLETACGTGVVSRRLRAMLPSARSLTSTDVSAAMLEAANECSQGLQGIEWMQADACELPFENGRFGAVVCQFGLAFVPDPGQALKEAFRVLSPGGRLYFSLWQPPGVNAHSRLFDEVCDRFAGDAVAAEDRDRPYALSNPSLLHELLMGAGFEHACIEALTLRGTSPSAYELAMGAITGTPRARQLARAKVPLDKVVDSLAHALAMEGGDSPCELFLHALVSVAQK
jgi:SAM-dependent methyltransferase